MDIVLISEGVQDGQENCVQLITCTTGPIQGNLFWYAQFSNGSEARFARNDGGNAESSPPYNEITLDGVTDYQTIVTREVMNNNLFTNFNSTLAFSIKNLVHYNLTTLSCGSVNSNSSKITPLIPQIDSKSIFVRIVC